VKETSTDYRRPYRPRPIALANRALEPLFRTFRLSLDEDSLLRAAERKTWLSDFGDESFREPLRRLVRSIDREAALHPIGRLITRLRLTSGLATRLRVEQMIKRAPAILEQPIARPIVILGLPRTGTTLLHRLLAADPRLRALQSWEALSPAPLAGHDERQRRIASAERAERSLRYMAPDFFAVHPIDARGPEEDILLLDLAFRSTVPESTMRVPGFASWLEEQDQLPAYRYHKRLLQVLSWQRAGQWVLKTPHHLEWVDELVSVYPDALLVWTHRDPAEVVPSFCSMIAHGRGVFSDAIDPHEIGASWLRKGARMVSRAMAARERLGAGRFFDVKYGDFVRAPIETVKRIVERAGLDFTPEAERAVREAALHEKKDRHGVHRYALADFGLTDGDVDRAFADYRERFGLSRASRPRTAENAPRPSPSPTS
jgi:hypothetical protein